MCKSNLGVLGRRKSYEVAGSGDGFIDNKVGKCDSAKYVRRLASGFHN
jgi:hypothetical protein